jgi:hypothetical protein
LVGAGVALIVWQTARDALPSCPAVGCQDSQRSSIQPTEDRGHTAATLVNVFGAVGLIGVASGLVVLTIAHPRAPEAALVLSPTGVRAIGRF